MRLKIFLFFSLIIFILLIFLVFVVLSKNSGDNKEKIESGELAYSCNCGWISWDHGVPNGVKNLIKEVVTDTSVHTGKKEVTYTQNMKIDFIGKSKFVARVSRKYVVARGQSKQKREEIALVIFQQTSESFEKMQGSFPFDLNYGSQSSSFKEGDLTGDKIAFYRALRGYTKEDIEQLCMSVSKDKSLTRLKEGKYGKSIKWQPDQEGVYPQELNEVNSVARFSNGELVFIDETRKIYLDF